MKYHVVEGIALKKDVDDGTLPTLAGQDLQVSVGSGRKRCDIVLNRDTKVVDTDILAKNGVIHVIDKVLVPPSVGVRAITSPSILEIAAEGDDFSTLAGAVTQFEDIVEALSSEGPFTVFAPTNKAFEDLGIDLGTLDAETLKNILQYHVISGEFSCQIRFSSML